MVNNSAMKSSTRATPETLWSHLHWLVVLGEQGSYTGAAARLGVSKAAMSQHIAELERAAGVPLVRRTTRNWWTTHAEPSSASPRVLPACATAPACPMAACA